MKLFTIPGACSTADHIALQWTGQPFEVEVLTPEKLKSPDYLALNPAGTVPALKDDDFLLTQNVAILNYVGDSYPQARLFGDGSARQRAEATRWLMLCNADMQPVFGTFFAPMSYIADPAQHASLHASSHLKLRRLFERAWLMPTCSSCCAGRRPSRWIWKGWRIWPVSAAACSRMPACRPR